jgi:UDP-N-acetylmuramoyl-tripeptide--D-alanyl-D-alanine ligase
VIRTSVRALVEASGAELLGGDPEATFTGVSTDTRSLQPGDFFFSLSGPNFDGNAFAAAAVEGGAVGAMLRKDGGAPPRPSAHRSLRAPLLLHPDPRRALSDFARWHRSRLDAAVVGVTGSCGKTTTKNILLELLRAVLLEPDGAGGAGRRVVGSPSSFNNDVGVPHTLFLADGTTEVCVVELGTNHPGEIAALCRTARPTAGIVTNVGAAHLEGLRSVEGVAQEKGSLVAALPRDGFCVLNADSPWSAYLRSLTDARVVTFSVDGEGDLDARDVWFHSAGTTFRLDGRDVTSPLLGLHNVQNLLAALAACRELGLELDRCLAAVSRLKPGHRRLERRVLGGTTLIDDSYNSNPESARASVRVLAGLHGHRRRVLVLGDMLELGPRAPELHHEVGGLAAASGVDLLVAVGELGKATAAGALEAGLAASGVVHLADVDVALREVPALLREGDVVLVKGSRQAGLDRVVQHLIEQRSGDAA